VAHHESRAAELGAVTAERDQARAEAERRGAELAAAHAAVAEHESRAAALDAIAGERDQARAECERVRADLDELGAELRMHKADVARLTEVGDQHEKLATLHEEAQARLEQLQAEIEGFKTELETQRRLLAETSDTHAAAQAALTAEHEVLRAHWGAEQQTRQTAWDEERRRLGEDTERLLSEERQRHEREQHDLRAEHQASHAQADQARLQREHDLEQLRNEARTLQEQVANLEQRHDQAARERDEAVQLRADTVRERDEIGAEHQRVSADRHEIQERLAAAERAAQEQAAAHRVDMAQLADEFDKLRGERDAAARSAQELAQYRDLLAANRAELDGTRQETADAHQVALDHVANEREELRTALEALRGERDQLQVELEAVRRQAETTTASPAPTNGSKREAELESQLQNAETSRSVLIDALKVAQKQVHDLTVELNESLAEQNRVRSILNGMGIHLL
jgi:chromosome segregation ATPase